MTAPREHHIRIGRSARWYALGEPGPGVREIWLAVHGYGQLARDFLETLRPIASFERFIVAPEALSRFYLAERGMDHRKAPVGGSWMTREDREAEIVDYVDYLDAVAERARAAAPSAERLVALGFSQGSVTVSRWAVFGSVVPDRLILWGAGPADDMPAERMLERFAARPVEIVHGRHDRVVPLEVAERGYSRLREAGVAAELRLYEGGHRLDAAVLAALAGAGVR